MGYQDFLRKLAHMQVEHPFIILALLASLTLIMLAGASLMQVNASLEQMMPQDTPEIATFTQLRDNGMGQDIIAIVVSTSFDENVINDVTAYEIYTHLNDLSTRVVKHPNVHATHSYADHIPAVGRQTYEALITTPTLQDALTQYVTEDKRHTVLLLETDVGADDARIRALIDEIEEDIQLTSKPAGVTHQITGTPVIQQRLATLVQQDRSNTQWIATLLVLAITALLFTSFTSAVVPIIIVTISVNWLYGTMGFAGLPISTLAGGVAAMVIGIGIDFAIHVMNKFRYERKSGASVKKSVELAVMHTGVALTATSLTTIAAFLAFMIGVMPEMNRFGLLMAMGIFYSLTFTLIGLPALLVLEERLLYWIKKKGHFGVEGEFHLEGGHD